jgi:2'-hydroxyisoflavone reductase
MKLLFIGGTRFVGRHLVHAAREAGHEITIFHRGQSNPDLFPKIERILGDRDADLDRLDGGRWEAVIDTCGYFPQQVRASAEKLSDKVQLYTFISTLSVYADFSRIGLDESAPLASTKIPDQDEITGENYGPLKASCEAAVQEVFADKVFIPRPGLIVGPDDTTDRFTNWVRRGLDHKPFPAPAPGDQPVQMIDARDLAAWIIDGVERGLSGPYNTTGPAERLTIQAMLEACLDGTNSQSNPVWIDSDFLLEHELEPWSDLPLWMPEKDERGLLAVDCHKAISAGLRFRPLANTVADIAAWDRARGLPPLKAGLSEEQQANLLQAWRAQRT